MWLRRSVNCARLVQGRPRPSPKIMRAGVRQPDALENRNSDGTFAGLQPFATCSTIPVGRSPLADGAHLSPGSGAAPRKWHMVLQGAATGLTALPTREGERAYVEDSLLPLHKTPGGQNVFVYCIHKTPPATAFPSNLNRLASKRRVRTLVPGYRSRHMVIYDTLAPSIEYTAFLPRLRTPN